MSTGLSYYGTALYHFEIEDALIGYTINDNQKESFDHSEIFHEDEEPLDPLDLAQQNQFHERIKKYLES